MNIIPNIFHIFNYLDYTNKNDIEVYKFFSIKSIIEINKPTILYYYYYSLPNGFLWEKIKNLLTPKKIEITDNKELLIYNALLDHGGIYININSLCIKPFKPLLKFNFIKSRNNEIICSEKNSYIVQKFFEYYNLNKLNDIKYEIININGQHINNKLLENLNYDNSLDNTNNIIFKEIYDYAFSEYFHLIKNCYIIDLYNIDSLKDINLYDIFNKITIYNLLIRNVLSYNFINNNLQIYNKPYSIINNIDIIYWLNLEKSTQRMKNMVKILNNFNINNIKINAVDGNLVDNIHTKYFYTTDDIYPKYSNKEYAILLSHLNTIEIYSKLSNLNYGVSLICEDDLSLDFINYWNKDLRTIIEEAPEDWDIIMLGYFSLNLNRNNNYEKWNNEWSALSYLINHKSSQKINNLKKNDKWLCNHNDLMVSDNYIFSKFNTYVYKYPYFTFPNNNDSTFHEDHLDYHRLYKMSNYITLENIYSTYL
jgi:GR25 family glycosyltransferase involved in LPS biosynthesis